MKKSILLCFTVLFFTSKGQSQCEAAFSYVFSGGGFSVNITDQSTATAPDSIISWSWTVDGTFWSNQQNIFLPQAISPLVCLTITTASGCNNTTCETVVNGDPCETFSYNIFTSPETRLGNDGEIEAYASGGTFPYTYQWSNGSNASTITNLSAGDIYTVSIADANGCILIESAAVALDTACYLTMSLFSAFPQICDNDGEINIVTAGGYGDISYQWNNGASTESINNLNEGTYSVSAEDATGCIATIDSIFIPYNIIVSGQFTTCLLPFDSAFVSNAIVISPTVMNLTWDCYKNGILYQLPVEYTVGDCLECFIPEVHFACQNPLLTQYFIEDDTICRDIETRIFNTKPIHIDANIYPNPSTGTTIIEAKNIQNVSVITLEGKTILVTKKRGDKLIIDISQQPKGIYFVKVVTDEGMTVQRIILK